MPSAAAAAPDAGEIERLYTEGSDLNSRKDYAGAAEAWTRLLLLLPEQGSNQATRENILLNVIEAHINAYHAMRKPDHTKDISHLENGKKTLDLYLQQFRAVYGDRRGISPAVQQRSDELDEALRKAQEELDAHAPTSATTSPATTQPKPTPAPIGPDVIAPKLPPQNNGTGLIVGGSVAIAAGLGALGMLIGGAVAASKAQKDYEGALGDARMICRTYPDTACTSLTSEQQTQLARIDSDRIDADKRGHRGNALTIAGGVVAPVLIGAGAAMLAFGIKRHRAAARVNPRAQISPQLGPGYAGIHLQGKF